MNKNRERLVLYSEREGAEKRERKPWQRRKERQKERERSVSWSVGGSRSVAATPRTLKSTSFQYPILTCFVSVMEIPLSLPQIFSKVSDTHKCPGEVVLWKLNKRVAVGTMRPEGDLELEVRRRKISPSRVTKLLRRLWTIPSMEWDLILSRSDQSERLLQTTSIKMNQQTRVLYVQGKPSINDCYRLN